jgi:hypothetical protein
MTGGFPEMADDKPMEMLPPELRSAPDKDVDEYIEDRLHRYEMAMQFTEAGNDPIRRQLALDSLRMVLDPRIDQKEVRARSTAFLNVAKTLGLDRDLAKSTIDGETVENMLKRLRDAAERGADAAGRLVSKRARRTSGEVSSGPAVFLCEPSSGGGREVETGSVREAVSDAGDDSGQA